MKSKLSCVSIVVIDEMTVEEEAEAVVLVTSSSPRKMDKMMMPLSDSAKSMFKCDNTIDADPCSIVPSIPVNFSLLCLIALPQSIKHADAKQYV